VGLGRAGVRAAFLAVVRVGRGCGGLGGGVAPVEPLLPEVSAGIGGSTRPFEPLLPLEPLEPLGPPLLAGAPVPLLAGAGRFGGRGSATVSSRPVSLGRSAIDCHIPLVRLGARTSLGRVVTVDCCIRPGILRFSVCGEHVGSFGAGLGRGRGAALDLD
jgi:hypothetical protein